MLARSVHLLSFSLCTLLASCGGSEPASATPGASAGPSSGGTDDAAPAWFREAAAERGLVFRHVRGEEKRFDFPEIMGGGVALLDADGDGDLDVYLVQSGDLLLAAREPQQPYRNRLFENSGDGHFVDVTDGPGASDAGDRGYGMGVTAGDYDGDGDTDLYITNVGRNTLLRNEGGLMFRDVTDEAGVGDLGWGTSAAFLDADGDQDLDLFVTNYLAWSPQVEMDCSGPTGPDYCSPGSYGSPAADTLFENRGDGTFRDVSRAAGIGEAFGNGLGVTLGDFNGDGRPDIYVANDMMPNQLWINDGGMRFHDDALFAGCAANRDGESEAGMGAVAFDLEGDGDLDLFLTHLREETNTLYVNTKGVFRDRTAALGLAGPSLAHTGFGVVLADFDQDGLRDVYIADGSVTRNRPPLVPGDAYAEPDMLFRGRSEGRFEEVVPEAGVSKAAITTSRGAAAGDLDGDGDLDLVVVDSNGSARLLLNVIGSGDTTASKPAGTWIAFDLVNPGADGRRVPILSAGVRIETAGGPQWGFVQRASGYCSSQPATVHFGLGAASGTTSALVRWPDGREQIFADLAIGERHVLRR